MSGIKWRGICFYVLLTVVSAGLAVCAGFVENSDFLADLLVVFDIGSTSHLKCWHFATVETTKSIRWNPAMNYSASWKRPCAQLLMAFVVAVTAMAATPAEANDPPVITGFTWYNPWGDYYAFYGFVVDEFPGECGVGFEGLIDGGGVSTDYDGYFCVIVEFPPATAGLVYATAMDNLYQLSQVVSTMVF